MAKKVLVFVIAGIFTLTATGLLIRSDNISKKRQKGFRAESQYCGYWMGDVNRFEIFVWEHPDADFIIGEVDGVVYDSNSISSYTFDVWCKRHRLDFSKFVYFDKFGNLISE